MKPHTIKSGFRSRGELFSTLEQLLEDARRRLVTDALAADLDPDAIDEALDASSTIEDWRTQVDALLDRIGAPRDDGPP